MYKLKKERYDYFIIWGNGLQYKEEIIEIIEGNPYLEILAIKKHCPKNVEKLVKAVYSYDYAPFKHLTNKTRYLLSTEASVLFIFIRNNNPRETYIEGNPLFKHKECLTIKSVKEEIRDRFNERKGDRRTEDHVVHASDNQSQTDYILKYLGYKEGVGKFKSRSNLLIPVTYHLGKFNRFSLKEVDLSDVYCSIATGPETDMLRSVCETPHYRFLSGDVAEYNEYRTMFEDFPCMMDDQFPARYKKFASSFEYLKAPYSTSYILAKEVSPGRYQIIDGVHRIAILAYRGINNCIIAVKK